MDYLEIAKQFLGKRKLRNFSCRDYRSIKIPGHPLARANGCVRVHRAVLYDKIGPGTHPCHWCGLAVAWMSGEKIQTGMLVVDHLDGDRLNNNSNNLVPSCNGCNALRNRGWRIKEGELFVIDGRGDRIRAEKIRCLNCGSEFVARPRTGTKRQRKFCSLHCSGVYSMKDK